MKTEPIGSIPRPLSLIQAISAFQSGELSREALDEAYASALRDTIDLFEQTGSPVITDGEQTKPSFAIYPLSGLNNLAPDGIIIPFADGHVRQLPRLTAGPFRYGVYAAKFLNAARSYTKLPVKQAVTLFNHQTIDRAILWAHKEGTSDREDIAAPYRCLPVVLFGNIVAKEPDEEPIVGEPGREDRFKNASRPVGSMS